MSDQTRTPSLADVATGAAITVTAGVRVSRAGRVVAYDPDAQTADVQILPSDVTTRTDGTLVVVPAPTVYGAPVAMPNGGDVSFTFGLEVGALVYVIYRDVSHDEFDQSQSTEVYTPQDPRRWDPADVVVWPYAHAPSRMDGAPVVAFGVNKALRVGAADAAEAVAMAAAVRDEMNARDSAIANHTHAAGSFTDSLSVLITGISAPATYVAPAARALGSERLLTDDTITPGAGVTT